MPEGTRPAKGKGGSTETGSAPDSSEDRLTYVYGIFPGDVNLDADLTGVGEPPAKIRIVRRGDIAALVSDVTATASLGSPGDLAVHKEILDASASAVPVLPMRFGAILADDQAVAEELLDDNHDVFAAALQELDGRVQYVVKGRYVERTLIHEVLSENNDAAQMHEAILQAGNRASHDAKMWLGEMIENAVAAKREEDTRTLADRLDGLYEASAVRDPRHERDAFYVALLVKSSRSDDLKRALDELATNWKERVELRLLGPMASYDFVVPEPGALT